MTPALRRGAFERVRRILAPWPDLADRLVVNLDKLPRTTLARANYVPAGAIRTGAETWLLYPSERPRKKPLTPLVVQVIFSVVPWRSFSDRERREIATHEAAHLLADHFDGPGIGVDILDHGPEWRAWTKRLCGRELAPCM